MGTARFTADPLPRLCIAEGCDEAVDDLELACVFHLLKLPPGLTRDLRRIFRYGPQDQLDETVAKCLEYWREHGL